MKRPFAKKLCLCLIQDVNTVHYDKTQRASLGEAVGGSTRDASVR